jgi:hypothetical protein
MLMRIDERCIYQLCDPDALSEADAIRLADSLSRMQPALDRELAYILECRSKNPDLDTRIIQRAHKLIASISDPRYIKRPGHKLSNRYS